MSCAIGYTLLGLIWKIDERYKVFPCLVLRPGYLFLLSTLLDFPCSTNSTYTNVLNMLDLGEMPLRCKDRKEGYPSL